MTPKEHARLIFTKIFNKEVKNITEVSQEDLRQLIILINAELLRAFIDESLVYNTEYWGQVIIELNKLK